MHPDIQRGMVERQLEFRAMNERIYASADAFSLVESIPFVCECAASACTEIVRLSDDEYDTITRDPHRFFNVSGHELPSVAAGTERILSVVGELTVVVKIGIAGDVAADSRARIPC